MMTFIVNLSLIVHLASNIRFPLTSAFCTLPAENRNKRMKIVSIFRFQFEYNLKTLLLVEVLPEECPFDSPHPVYRTIMVELCVVVFFSYLKQN